MKDVLVIFNPASGRRDTTSREQTLRETFAKAGLEFDLVHTERPGHAADLAREAEPGAYASMLAAGGDGTVSEVANGLLQRRLDQPESEERFAVYSMGSGNDFAANVGCPAGLAGIAEALRARRCRQVDVGRLKLDGEASYFFNNLGIGFEAQVTLRSRRIRIIRGLPLYLAATVLCLFDDIHAGFTVRLESPDAEDARFDEELMMLSIAVGARTGGGFRIIPQALPDDGLLDIAFIPRLSKRGMIGLLGQILKGTHTGRSDLRFRTFTRAEIRSEPGMPVHADGEVMTRSAHSIEVEMLPGALPVIV